MKLLIIVFMFSSIECNFDLIPERSNLSYYNTKYVDMVKFVTYRSARRGPYYFDVTARVKQTWADNVTMHAVFYEFLSNSYKRSIIEVHGKICKWISKNHWLAGSFPASLNNISCPIQPGYYKLNKIPIMEVAFPNLFPFQKIKISFAGTRLPENETIFEGYINALIKNKLR